MRRARSWLRCNPMATDSIVAALAFALGVLSIRISYDLGTAQPHFRFATGVAFIALLTSPLASGAVCPRSPWSASPWPSSVTPSSA